jgi:hypothetical protein
MQIAFRRVERAGTVLHARSATKANLVKPLMVLKTAQIFLLRLAGWSRCRQMRCGLVFILQMKLLSELLGPKKRRRDTERLRDECFVALT